MRGARIGDVMGDLSSCYSWEAIFSPQVRCGTSNQTQSVCPDATWFWVVAAGIGLVAIFKKK
jgi:hypothetical protein